MFQYWEKSNNFYIILFTKKKYWEQFKFSYFIQIFFSLPIWGLSSLYRICNNIPLIHSQGVSKFKTSFFFQAGHHTLPFLFNISREQRCLSEYTITNPVYVSPKYRKKRKFSKRIWQHSPQFFNKICSNLITSAYYKPHLSTF